MMNDSGDLREDLKLPDGDLGNQIRTDFDNGRELLVSMNSIATVTIQIVKTILSQ